VRPRLGRSARGRGSANKRRFPNRGGDDWKGPIIDYKEIELLRKFVTTSNKMMSRKRAGTNAREQRDLKRALKYARFLALLPYTGV
jgi:small subunit ribosomal protein S18